MQRIPRNAKKLKRKHSIPHRQINTLFRSSSNALGAFGATETSGDGSGRACAGGEGEADGGDVEEGESEGEPHRQAGWVVAEEHVQVDGGDGVEEGAAGEEESLDYHGAVMNSTNILAMEIY